ncbi:DUF3784 domain-containing protein [Lachnospiraceae bacterium 54-53]
MGGFHSLPKVQRELYDTERMSRDQRNAIMLWSIIMAAGAVFSYSISQYTAIAAFIIWLIVFFKDVHTDIKRAFGKYKIK